LAGLTKYVLFGVRWRRPSTESYCAFDARAGRDRNGLPVGLRDHASRHLPSRIFTGAALTTILVIATLALLIGLERAPIRSAAPR